MRACRAAGPKALWVSGRCSFSSEPVRQRLEIDVARSHVLRIDADGQLTGEMVLQTWSIVVDGTTKR